MYLLIQQTNATNEPSSSDMKVGTTKLFTANYLKVIKSTIHLSGAPVSAE